MELEQLLRSLGLREILIIKAVLKEVLKENRTEVLAERQKLFHTALKVTIVVVVAFVTGYNFSL